MLYRKYHMTFISGVSHMQSYCCTKIFLMLVILGMKFINFSFSSSFSVRCYLITRTELISLLIIHFFYSAYMRNSGATFLYVSEY